MINVTCTLLEYQKLHDLSQIKIFQLFTRFGLNRSWHCSTIQGFAQMEIFLPTGVWIIFLFISVTFVIISRFDRFQFFLFIFQPYSITKQKIIFTNIGIMTFKTTISIYFRGKTFTVCDFLFDFRNC